MSRVGKLPVAIPSDVKVELNNGRIVIKGKLGELTANLVPGVKVVYDQAEKHVVVTPANESKEARALWGTYRNNIKNMVQGVVEGFVINLEINGVGFRASVDGTKYLTLTLGYSHEIKYAIPKGITLKCEKQTSITISGADKQKVGQVAGELMKLRPVEPYKGKGVYIAGSYIRRKEGKKK